jgi:membrane protease YdiL (CAAX protease family)
MGENRNLFSLYGKSPFYQLFISLLVILGTGILLFSFFFLAGKLIFNSDAEFLKDNSSIVSANDLAFLRYILISQHISFFIVPAIILLIKLKPDQMVGFPDFKRPQLSDVVLVIILAFCTFPITGFTGQLNAGMHLPDWLSGVEKWMVEKEESADRLIELILTGNNFWAVFLNLILVAVLPAIGEELIFRGVFQKIFYRIFKSGHLAIFVTAFIFSAMHFQFLGFLPRFILGLLFGYLFFWSGTLWLPVISHFVNNAVSVLAAYSQGWNRVIGSQPTDVLKGLIVLVLPILACIVILLYFRNKSRLSQNPQS